ncbi:MAG TPA: cyclodeaminase/cyclohydrolase family protein [Streptosporangiaceae bacterium]|nr:cyclodeaminase/cyclohydrolase family protein [Streptosporangiaceae bacterium]
MTQPDSFAELPVGQFLDALAAGTPAPAGGSAAALTVAQAAALCAKAARLSARQLTAERAGQLTIEAERIRFQVAALIDADAVAYRAVIDQARHAAAVGNTADSVGLLAQALSLAADVPMQVVEHAAQIAEIAAPLAAYGNPALRGDAVTAALLAQAGARSAATLVTVNLADAPDDPRPARAFDLLSGIAQAVGKAAAER